MGKTLILAVLILTTSFAHADDKKDCITWEPPTKNAHEVQGYFVACTEHPVQYVGNVTKWCGWALVEGEMCIVQTINTQGEISLMNFSQNIYSEVYQPNNVCITPGGQGE